MNNLEEETKIVCGGGVIDLEIQTYSQVCVCFAISVGLCDFVPLSFGVYMSVSLHIYVSRYVYACVCVCMYLFVCQIYRRGNGQRQNHYRVRYT